MNRQPMRSSTISNFNLYLWWSNSEWCKLNILYTYILYLGINLLSDVDERRVWGWILSVPILKLWIVYGLALSNDENIQIVQPKQTYQFSSTARKLLQIYFRYAIRIIFRSEQYIFGSFYIMPGIDYSTHHIQFTCEIKL